MKCEKTENYYHYHQIMVFIFIIFAGFVILHTDIKIGITIIYIIWAYFILFGGDYLEKIHQKIDYTRQKIYELEEKIGGNK